MLSVTVKIPFVISVLSPSVPPETKANLKAFILELKEHGLTGIEAIYSANSPGDERNFCQIAKEYDLLISGGSDYHGANKPYLHLGTGKGGLLIPDEILIPIKKAAGVL